MQNVNVSKNTSILMNSANIMFWLICIDYKMSILGDAYTKLADPAITYTSKQVIIRKPNLAWSHHSAVT